MSGKSFARAAISAFIAARHGSARFACENPMTYLACAWRPQAVTTVIASATTVARWRVIRRHRDAPLRTAPPLQPDGDENDGALEDELKICIDVVQSHGIVDDAD